jgi:hypothetical protein
MNNILLIKRQVLLGHDAHYAGGVHLFSCLTQTLSNSGWNVQVFTICDKHLLLHHAAMHGLLHQLQPSADNSSLISWQAQKHLRYCVVTECDQAADAVQLLLRAVVDRAHQLTKQQPQPPLVLLDADALQHVLLPAGAGDSSSMSSSTLMPNVSSTTSTSTSTSPSHSKHPIEVIEQPQPFLQALMCSLYQCDWRQHTQQPDHLEQQQLPCSAPKVVMLVQNLHHLPFGPYGTAARCLGVLQAWQQLSGILCVSTFVAGYMHRHALPLLRLNTSSGSITGRLQPVHVVHPAALGAFGDGPFPDLGAAAASRLWLDPPDPLNKSMNQRQRQQQQGQLCKMHLAQAVQQQQQDQQQTTCDSGSCRNWQLPPVVTMLKLTYEKGSDIFLSLATQLPDIQFRAVCADVQSQQCVAAAKLANVKLVPPAAAVSEALVDTSLVIVPSILAEAFGLVVVDSMLRGLPVIVADAGALPEAAAGAAVAVLPVQMVQFPVAKSSQASLAEAKQAVISKRQQQQVVPAMPTIPKLTSVGVLTGGGAAAAAAAAGASTSADGLGMTLPSPISNAACIEEWMSSQRSWQGRRTVAAGEEGCDAHKAIVNGWVAVVQQVLSCKCSYVEYSQRSKTASSLIMSNAGQELMKLLTWLHSIAL